MKKRAIFNEALKMAYELKDELSWVPSVQAGMDLIIHFFMVTSPYYDEGKGLLEEGKKIFFFSKRKKDKEKYVFLSEFSRFLENTGRSEWGWNRTKKGENPGAYNVYIPMIAPFDEVFYTLSMAEYFGIQNSPEKLNNSFLKDSARGKYNLYQFIEKEFVAPFMKNNYNHLVKILDDYEK